MIQRGIVFLFVLSALFMTNCGDDGNEPPTSGGGQPTISSITPSAASRGQKDVTANILGTNLTSVTSVSMGDGITVHQFTGVSATQIDLRFSVTNNAAAGPRTVSVNTTHGSATSSSHFSISNNRAPVAKFTVSATTGARNTEFEFDASESSDPDGSISRYQWEFGDGATASGKKATHKFSAVGKFQVRLIVTDDSQATDAAGREIEIIEGVAPIARFTVTPPNGTLDTTFTFDASGSSDDDGNITKYEFLFGDGKNAEGKVVQHKYSSGKTFTVRLVVTDNDGIEDASERDVRVEGRSDSDIYKAISATLFRFFELYSNLHRLSAEEILREGWSDDPECPGKERERRIINDVKSQVQSSNANILSIDTFIFLDRTKAKSRVVARFDTVFNDGTKETGKATHVFDMVKEGEKWNICNFILEKIETD